MTGDQNPGTRCGAVAAGQGWGADRCEFDAGHGLITAQVGPAEYPADHGAPSVGHYWTVVPAPVVEVSTPTVIRVGPDDRLLMSFPDHPNVDRAWLDTARAAVAERWGAGIADRTLIAAGNVDLHVISGADWQLDEERERTDMPHREIYPSGPGEDDVTALVAPEGPTGFQTPAEILADFAGHTPTGPDPDAVQGRADIESVRDWLMGWVGQQPGIDAIRVAVGYGNLGKAFRFYPVAGNAVEVTLREVTE